MPKSTHRRSRSEGVRSGAVPARDGWPRRAKSSVPPASWSAVGVDRNHNEETVESKRDERNDVPSAVTADLVVELFHPWIGRESRDGLDGLKSSLNDLICDTCRSIGSYFVRTGIAATGRRRCVITAGMMAGFVSIMGQRFTSANEIVGMPEFRPSMLRHCLDVIGRAALRNGSAAADGLTFDAGASDLLLQYVRKVVLFAVQGPLTVRSEARKSPSRADWIRTVRAAIDDFVVVYYCGWSTPDAWPLREDERTANGPSAGVRRVSSSPEGRDQDARRRRSSDRDPDWNPGRHWGSDDDDDDDDDEDDDAMDSDDDDDDAGYPDDDNDDSGDPDEDNADDTDEDEDDAGDPVESDTDEDDTDDPERMRVWKSFVLSSVFRK